MDAESLDEHFESLKRQARVIELLESAEAAGLVPINILRLHAFAYLANVLAPTWDLDPLDGKILKRQGGPFYPQLQTDIDRLVGRGLVRVSQLGHVQDEMGRWRLDGSYELNRHLAASVLDYLANSSSEARVYRFVRELALAISALSETDFDLAMTEDATYSDPLVSPSNVIDFDEWRKVNYSASAAKYFHDAGAGFTPTPGEQLHLYVRHLYRRIHRAGK